MNRALGLAIAVGVAALSGCMTTRIAGCPIILGPTPTEIELPTPLRTGAQWEKALEVKLLVESQEQLPISRFRLLGIYEPDNIVYYLDGRRIKVQAELVLEDGTSLLLDGNHLVGCREVKIDCYVHFDTHAYGRSLVITKVRLVASEQIVARSIYVLVAMRK